MWWWLACAPEPAPPEALDPADCVVATPEDVRDRRGDWYRCLDTKLAGGDGCGPDGYPLGFGAKYADKSYDEVWDRMSADGQAFLLGVGPCLQERLAAEVTAGTTCGAVWDLGFGTHAACYVDAGFCDLGPADLLAVAEMIEEDAAALPELQEQFTEVSAACAAR